METISRTYGTDRRRRHPDTRTPLPPPVDGGPARSGRETLPRLLTSQTVALSDAGKPTVPLEDQADRHAVEFRCPKLKCLTTLTRTISMIFLPALRRLLVVGMRLPIAQGENAVPSGRLARKPGRVDPRAGDRLRTENPMILNRLTMELG